MLVYAFACLRYWNDDVNLHVTVCHVFVLRYCRPADHILSLPQKFGRQLDSSFAAIVAKAQPAWPPKVGLLHAAQHMLTILYVLPYTHTQMHGLTQLLNCLPALPPDQ